MKYFVVDTFTNSIFKGNPAGICILDKPIPANVMQSIAFENNLSETAFILKNDYGDYSLKWFTPKAEINLCGHATIGSAFIISNFIDIGISKMEFHTLSGLLKVTRYENLYQLELPSYESNPIDISDNMIKSIGVTPIDAFLTRDLVLVLSNENLVSSLTPNFNEMLNLKDGLTIIVTAKSSKFDFVLRCFAPKLLINEDPVTGSAFSSLVPYWSKKLNKSNMIAKQLSKREGIIKCQNCKNTAIIEGQVVLYLHGDIYI